MKSRIDSIQALRGFGALMIMLQHFSKTLIPGGYGVDIFFIVSGFILVYSTQNGMEGFGVKRAIRILPLYYFVTLTQFFLHFVVYKFQPTDYHRSLLSLTWLTKSLLFDRSVDPIVLPGWTLNIEIAFYCVFGVAGLLNHKHRAALASVLIIVFIDRVMFMEFVFGMFSFYAFKYIIEKITITAKLRVLCTIICLAILTFFIITQKIETFERGTFRQYKWGIAAFIFFISFLISTYGLKVPKPLMTFGNMSFSLYLWHPPVLFSTMWILDKLNLYDQTVVKTYGYSLPQTSEEIRMLILCGVVAIIIVLPVSYLSYIFIEKKFTSFLKSKITPNKLTKETV